MNWTEVPETTISFAKRAMLVARRFQDATRVLPPLRHHALFNPETGVVHVGLGKEASDDEANAWDDGLSSRFADLVGAPIDVPPAGFGKEPWVWIKQAVDPYLSGTAKLLNYQPSALNSIIGGPSPLAAALASGLVGAGIGYAGGSLVENLLPPNYLREGVLRRNAAVLGGLAATTPALLWGITSHQANPDTPGWRAWLSSWPFRRKDIQPQVKKACEELRQDDRRHLLEKKAFSSPFQPFWRPGQPYSTQPLGQGLDQLGAMPNIDKDRFSEQVWQDPYTPVPIRAATVGLVNTASMASGGKPFVSPWDIASVAATGAAKGLIVGKTLGALAGLTPDSQDAAMRMGIWGGLLSAVVPNAFPNSNRLFGQYG